MSMSILAEKDFLDFATFVLCPNKSEYIYNIALELSPDIKKLEIGSSTYYQGYFLLSQIQIQQIETAGQNTALDIDEVHEIEELERASNIKKSTIKKLLNKYAKSTQSFGAFMEKAKAPNFDSKGWHLKLNQSDMVEILAHFAQIPATRFSAQILALTEKQELDSLLTPTLRENKDYKL